MQITGTDTLVLGNQSFQSVFTGVYSAPNLFRLEVSGSAPMQDWKNGSAKKYVGTIVYGCTGTLLYQTISVQKQYFSQQVPPEKIDIHAARSVLGLLSAESCPPIYFAIMKDGTQTWREPSKVPKITLKKGADSNIDGKKCLTVIQEWPDLHRTLTLFIDASTYRVRRLTDTHERPDSKNVRTCDFAETKLDVPIDPNQFKWSPPPGWKKGP